MTLIVEEWDTRTRRVSVAETGRTVSIKSIQIGPTIAIHTEAPVDCAPSAPARSQEAAERGYWARMMRAWKTWGHR